MNYKVGDKIRIKTWDEMIQEFGITFWKGSEGITFSSYYFWDTRRDESLPMNRIITITGIGSYHCYFIGGLVYHEMIKGYANEYYLQEIKDEMEEHEKGTKRRK